MVILKVKIVAMILIPIENRSDILSIFGITPIWKVEIDDDDLDGEFLLY